MKAWTQWPCPARRGACHGLPEAERHHSGLPRLHPRQQGGAAGAGGQAAGGMAEDPSGVPVPPMSPAPPCRRDGGGPAWVPVPPTSCTPLPSTDDADQCPWCVCGWRRCHLPSGLEEQPQSEHSPLADGSRPGYHQPGGSRGREAVPGPSLPPGPPLSCCPWVLLPGSAIQGSAVACPASLTQATELACCHLLL